MSLQKVRDVIQGEKKAAVNYERKFDIVVKIEEV